jgi:hypothetical protein
MTVRIHSTSGRRAGLQTRLAEVNVRASIGASPHFSHCSGVWWQQAQGSLTGEKCRPEPIPKGLWRKIVPLGANV